MIGLQGTVYEMHSALELYKKNCVKGEKVCLRN